MAGVKLPYYDVNKTLSYNARINMIVTARDRGKTYGFRTQFIKDYLRTGYTRFCEVCRSEADIPELIAEYFGKVQENNQFPNHIFKNVGRNIYIAKKPKDEEEKPQWEHIGYVVALRSAQKLKRQTFINVYRILFDEAIIDNVDKSKSNNYLKNEYSILANVVDTVTRETPNSKLEPKLYLLGNAVDFRNPYFVQWGINKRPPFGYTWYDDHNVLLHYEDPKEWSQMRRHNTLAGKMLGNSRQGNMDLNNEFQNANQDFVEKKSYSAICLYGIVFEGDKFGVWADKRTNYIYITDYIPKGVRYIYSLTRADNTVDYMTVDKANNVLNRLASLYYANMLRYKDLNTRETFLDAMALFGIR